MKSTYSKIYVSRSASLLLLAVSVSRRSRRLALISFLFLCPFHIPGAAHKPSLSRKRTQTYNIYKNAVAQLKRMQLGFFLRHSACLHCDREE